MRYDQSNKPDGTADGHHSTGDQRRQDETDFLSADHIHSPAHRRLHSSANQVQVARYIDKAADAQNYKLSLIHL